MRSCNQRLKNRIELRTQEQPLVAKHIGGTIRAWNDPSRTRRTDEVPFIAGCSHFTWKNTRFRAPASSPKHSPCNIHAAIPMRSCNQRFKNRIDLRTQEQPLVAKHIGGTIRAWNDPSRTRRTDEVPFIAGCSHFTRKNTRFRAPASSPKHSPCNIHAAITMRSASTDSKTPYSYAHTSTPKAAWSHRYNAAKKKRPSSLPFFTTSLRHQSPSSSLPFVTTSLRHHSPSSSLPFVTTSLRHHSPSSSLPFITTSLRHHFPSSPPPLHHHFRSSPLPFLTTSLRHHLPSSPLPFLTTSLPHHSPSSPLPFFTTPLHHHFPSSPPPFVTTPLHHHFPSSPLPFIITSLPHHFPSSPLPFIITSLRHHFPSSPLPFVTTSLLHHFPSSPLPFITTSLLHHFPSSPLPFFTTSLPHHFPSSPLRFITTSLLHHSPSSSLPFVTTSLRYHSPSSSLPFFTAPLHHHFPSSPLPFVTTPLHHHFPSSPLPFVTTPLHHHFPSSPLPFRTTPLHHHFPSSPLPFVTTRQYHHPSSKSIPLLLILLLCIVMWSTTLQCIVIGPPPFIIFYLSVTRKYCFPTSFDNKIKDVTGHDTLPALSEAASSPVFSSSLSPRVFIKEEDCGEANIAIVDPLLFGQWMVSGQPSETGMGLTPAADFCGQGSLGWLGCWKGLGDKEPIWWISRACGLPALLTWTLKQILTWERIGKRWEGHKYFNVLNGVLHPDSLILSSNHIKIGPGLFPRLKGALLNDLRMNCPKFSLKKTCFADVRGVIRCKTMALLWT